MPDDQAPQIPQMPQPQTLGVQSNLFRLVYANNFRTRLGPGECMITFSTIIPAPAGMLAGIPGQPQPNPSMNLMQDEVVIALSWPVLKTFVSQINEIVNAIEQELGPIKGAKSARSSEQINEEYKNALQRILSD